MLAFSFLIALVVISVAIAHKLKDESSRSEEIMLPMRDGVKLHTVVHLPRTKGQSKTKFPTIMDRSPYGMCFIFSRTNNF